MKAELFYLYITNHKENVFFTLFVAILFLFARFYAYGLPETEEIIVYSLFLSVSTGFFFSRRRYYNEIIENKNVTDKNVIFKVIYIMALKLCYLMPWFLILFWPLRTEYLYDQVVGYFFVFCAVALYTSISAVFFPLFLFDISVVLACSFFIVMLNFDVQETPYIGAFLILSGVFSIHIGAKISKTSKELLQSRNDLWLAARRTEKAHRAKADFLAIMSHEIRTPMNGILSMVDFLKETRLTKTQKSHLEVISQCSGSLLRTLNDVLDISKIEAGKLSIEKINFNLHELLQGAVKVVEFSAKEKGLEPGLVIEDTVPVEICSDPNRLQQVLVNLLNNAIKFTEQGSVTVYAGYDEPQKRIHIEVRDTGCGISPKNQKKLFKKFSQAKESTAREHGGTGLGLFIVQSLVHLMGGQVGLKSRDVEGSTFWFEIPYYAPVEMQEVEKTSIKRAIGLHVLLAEDNHINQMVVVRLLKKAGHKVSVVQNGREALEAVQQNAFDIVLMDVNMPVMNGFEACRAIKALGEPYNRIPVIALTANVMPEQIKACYDAGMADHVTKPIDRALLYEKLTEYAPDTAVYDDADVTAHGLGEKVVEILEELGPEFLTVFAKENSQEIERLLTLSEQALGNSDYQNMQYCMHDMVSVAGNIGMDNVSQLSRKIEQSCLAGEYSEIEPLFKQLKEDALEQSEKLTLFVGSLS